MYLLNKKMSQVVNPSTVMYTSNVEPHLLILHECMVVMESEIFRSSITTTAKCNSFTWLLAF